MLVIAMTLARWIANVTVIPALTLVAVISITLERCGEMLSAQLNTIHNLRFYQTLMAGLREAIAETRLEAFAMNFICSRARISLRFRARGCLGFKSSIVPPTMMLMPL